MNTKTKIIIAVLLLAIYVISPVDIVPDALPGAGYLDDGAATILTLIYILIKKIGTKK